MYILGLNIGHNATACLLNDGKIIGCVSEERFSRKKNDWCYPKKAIEFCIKQGNINSGELDKVVFASLEAFSYLIGASLDNYLAY